MEFCSWQFGKRCFCLRSQRFVSPGVLYWNSKARQFKDGNFMLNCLRQAHSILRFLASLRLLIARTSRFQSRFCIDIQTSQTAFHPLIPNSLTLKCSWAGFWTSWEASYSLIYKLLHRVGLTVSIGWATILFRMDFVLGNFVVGKSREIKMFLPGKYFKFPGVMAVDRGAVWSIVLAWHYSDDFEHFLLFSVMWQLSPAWIF